MSCNDAIEIIESGDGLEVIIEKTETADMGGDVFLELTNPCGTVTEVNNQDVTGHVTQEAFDISIAEQVVELEIIEQLIINNPDIDPPTEDSDAIVCELEADSQININRVVELLPNGRIQHADKDTTTDACDIIGWSKESGAAGQMVKVVKLGILTGGAYGPIGNNYFLGNNGQVTNTAPTTGIWVNVGLQLKDTIIYVKIDEPIQRG
jgi:hypothetical protein